MMGLYSFVSGYNDKITDQFKASMQSQSGSYEILNFIKNQEAESTAGCERLKSEFLTNLEKARLHIAKIHSEQQEDYINIERLASYDALEKTAISIYNKIYKVVHENETAIEHLGSAFEINSALFIEQLRLDNLSKADLAELLNIPSSEEERLLFLQNAIKHFKNGLLEDAQNNLLYVERIRCEKIAKEDNYFILFLLGLSSLFHHEKFDLKQANNYFVQAAKYADAESDDNSAKLSLVLMGKSADTQASMNLKDHKIQNMLAGEIGFYTAYTFYLMGDFKEAQTYLENVRLKNPDFLEAQFLLAKCQAAEGYYEKAVETLQALFEVEKEYILKACIDGDFVNIKPVQNLLITFSNKAVLKADEIFQDISDNFENTINSFENFLDKELTDSYVEPIRKLVQEIHHLLERETLFDSINYINLINEKNIPQKIDEFRKTKEIHYEFKKRLDQFEIEYATYWYPLEKNERRIGELLAETKELLSTNYNAALDSYSNCMKIFKEHIRKIVIWENDLTANFEALAYSPDGKFIATSNLDGIEVWDAERGNLVWETNTFDENQIKALTYTPDSNFLASASEDKHLVVIDILNKKVKWHIKLESIIYTVAFSPDRMFFACGCRDKTVSVYRFSNGELFWSKKIHTSNVRAVRFSPDSNFLLTTGDDKTIKLLNIKDGNEVWSIKVNSFVYALDYSPDGKFFVSGGNDGVELWSSADGAPVWSKIQGHPHIRCVNYSHNGRYIASGGDDAIVRIWNAQTGEEFWTSKENGRVTGVAFSPDDRSIASCSTKLKLTLIFPITKKEKKELEIKQEERKKQDLLQKQRLKEYRIKNKLCITCGEKLSFMDKLTARKECKNCR